MLIRIMSFLFVAVISFSSVVYADPYVKISDYNFTSPGTPVDPGSVYGDFSLKLSTFPGANLPDQLQKLSRSIVGKYQNRTGNYLLTLEAFRKGERLFTMPLLAISYDEKTKYFLFRVSNTIKKDISLNKKVLETEPITSENNNIEVVLRSYYKKESSFDLSLLELVSSLEGDYSILNSVDPTGVAAKIVDTTKEFLEDVLKESEEIEDIYRVGMKFVHLAALDTSLYRSGYFDVEFNETNSPASKGLIRVNLKAWSVSSKFKYTVSGGEFKYVDPSSFTMMANAEITKNVRIFDFVQESGPKSTRSFLEKLLSSKGYQEDNIEGDCISLLNVYRKYLSNRDAVALYWATLKEYKHAFEKSKNGGKCAPQREKEFVKFGLPMEVLFYQN